MKKLPIIILLFLTASGYLWQGCSESDCPLSTTSLAHFDLLSSDSHSSVKLTSDTFNQFSPSSVVKKMKVFARGANLFVLSSVKDLDPELLNAGVTNYPVTRTFTGGVSFVF